MGSRTAKPFLTTNLIVFALGSDNVKSESGPFVAQGDAMIVDPVCRSEFNSESAYHNVFSVHGGLSPTINTIDQIWAIDQKQAVPLIKEWDIGAAFIKVELEYGCVKSVNRRKQKTMHRVWVHGKFQKPMYGY
ncbi:metallo-hydrolase/oxidoreductase superfamily protein [Tanacetum coccineum]